MLSSGLAVFKDVQPPANTSLPQITGDAAVNETLSCTRGAGPRGDANLIQSYSYQWTADGLEIVGAHNAYTVTDADVGAKISLLCDRH